MQRKMKQNIISRILCMMLIVAMALFTVGCKAEEKETPSGNEGAVTAPADDARDETSGDDAEGSEDAGPAAEVTELGEGAVSFNFSVVDKDGVETKFLIHTDAETVGAALQNLGLIEGEEDDYGLYVKKVNGITADYDVDKTYWAFYMNGEYAMSGVDVTAITEGDTYLFKVEK
ncbi:MAG: DUF4430 domain-containing protein [Lachnospiraceae bacterium]|nr:DUF4430 domain-containing protein [Lachnospiraceae bacterium]